MKRAREISAGELLRVLAIVLSAVCGCADDSPLSPPPSYEGYKVYMNNLTAEQVGDIADHSPYVGGWQDVQEAFAKDDWTFIGEARATQTFAVAGSFTHIIILWERVGVKFDAFENLSTGASIGYNGEGEPVDVFWTDSNMMYDEDHDAIEGPPDGKFATTNSGGSIVGGYLFFTMAGGFNGTTENPEYFRVTFEDYR